MKKNKTTFSFFYKCFVCYTLVVYALLAWVPFSGWIWGFVMMTFPLVIAGHLLYLIFSLFSNKKNLILPLIILLLGCFFLPRTYSFHSKGDNKTDSGRKSFKVMSYNVHVFQHYSDNTKMEVKQDIAEMRKWITTSGADVLCMPEYYNYEKSELFNVMPEFKKAGYKHTAYLNEFHGNRPENFWGLAIFSKLPIIAMKDTVFMAQNGMVSTDIKVGKDTVRIIALHMYSMTLQLDVLKNQKTTKGMIKEGKSTARQIKSGFVNHAMEMQLLEEWIKASPHPVIVCGDFNETPYGYVYGKTKALLNNAFEEKGSGFGFTFNKLPYFIRIDHQFYDPEKLSLVNFKTINSVKYSDHYPIMGTYQIRK